MSNFITTANGPNPTSFYGSQSIVAPQTLSLAGNTLALSGGGGAVSISAATSVALSTNKLTNTTYDALLDKTSTAGQTIVLEPVLEVRIEPKLEVQSTLVVQAVGGIFTEINGVDGIYTTGDLQVDGEIIDSFGNPGAAGQQLQSSGPGLPWVWGAGSGVGLTAVVAGSNIGVDNTNPIAPVINVAITSTLDMSGQNIINGNDIRLKGTAPSLDFYNSSNVRKAGLDYVESSDKITLSGRDVVAESLGAGRGHRMILNAFGAALTSLDADVTLQRSQTGLGIRTIATLEDNGVIQIGAPGIGTNPSLDLVPTSGFNATILADGTGLQQTTGGNITLTAASGSINIDAPTLIQYTQNDVNSVVIESLTSVPTNTIAAPSLYYEKVGGVSIDNINPPPTPIFVTPQFFWRYSGALSPTGLNLTSGYCNSQRVEVTTTIVMTGSFNDQILLGVVLVDNAAPTTYYSENAFSFDDVTAATDRAYVVAPVRVNLTGERNWSATFTSFFDAINIIDGSPCEIRIYGLLNNPGSQTLSEIRATNRIRPVRLWDV